MIFPNLHIAKYILQDDVTSSRENERKFSLARSCLIKKYILFAFLMAIYNNSRNPRSQKNCLSDHKLFFPCLFIKNSNWQGYFWYWNLYQMKVYCLLDLTQLRPTQTSAHWTKTPIILPIKTKIEMLHTPPGSYAQWAHLL